MYKYNNSYFAPRKLSLKRGSYDWVNQDCPDIVDSEGNVVVHFGILEKYIYPTNEHEQKQIVKFIDQSDKAFCRKFGKSYNGGLVKNLTIV